MSLGLVLGLQSCTVVLSSPPPGVGSIKAWPWHMESLPHDAVHASFAAASALICNPVVTAGCTERLVANADEGFCHVCACRVHVCQTSAGSAGARQAVTLATRGLDSSQFHACSPDLRVLLQRIRVRQLHGSQEGEPSLADPGQRV